MAFINNKQYTEILAARRNGDEKAKAIVDRYLHDGTQEDLDRMVNDFYGITEEAVQEQEEISQPEVQEVLPVPETVEAPSQVLEPTPEPTPDISELLDSELEGLIDEEEYKDVSFEDFLSDKKKNCLRAKKNSDYFKAFDAEGRANYLEGKKDKFNKSFDLRRQDIDRSYKDMDKALSLYSQNVGDLPDDEAEFNSDQSDKAYGDIVELGGKSHSFGRSWDEADNEAMKVALADLVMKYGKKNVQAALNIIKGDNVAYKNHRNNNIDVITSKYGKSLDGLLK